MKRQLHRTLTKKGLHIVNADIAYLLPSISDLPLVESRITESTDIEGQLYLHLVSLAH